MNFPKKLHRRIKRVIQLTPTGLAISLLVFGGTPVAAGSINEELFYNNGIIFYNPDNCVESTSSTSSWSGTTSSGLSDLQADFVVTYYQIAHDLSIEYGIPWEAVMAQGILESTSGTSTFAVERNNFFGIGAFDSNPDNAYSYDTPEEGWRGYYENIRVTATYRQHGAFNYPGDPYGYIEAIKAAGYATDSDYVSKVHSLIDSIIAFAEEQGYELSSEMVELYPEMVENAEKNSQGEGSAAELSSSSLDECCETSTGIKWEDGWIVSGMSGYIKESATEAADNGTFSLTDSSYKEEYSTDGQPNKILLHSTEGTNGDGTSGLALYSSGTPAHFTIDLQNRKVYQHFSINNPATSVIGDTAAGVQIEIIGFSTEDNADSDFYIMNYGDDEWEYLATLLKAISEETGIPLTSSVDWTSDAGRLSESDFEAYEGILGHMHAPNNDHTDPGDIWSMVEAALESATGSLESCETGLQVGGIGETTARAILQDFIDLADQYVNASSATYMGATFGSYCKDGPFYNCVALTRWFILTYTTVPEAADCAGDGWTIVTCITDAGYEGFTYSDEPKAYSVFSYGDGTTNHTGIVVNVNEDKSIDVIQSTCSGGAEATKGSYGYSTYSYDEWHGYYRFAQIDDNILKTN